MQAKSTIFSVLWASAVGLTVLFVPTQVAYAYLDPGTGSFLLQILLAGLMGLLFVLRMFRERIASVFHSMLGKKTDPVEAAGVSDNHTSTED